MRTMTIAVFLAALCCGAAVFVDEHWSLHQADSAMGAGDGGRAVRLYTELIAARPLFLDGGTLAVRRETAAYRALTTVLDAHEFSRAAALMNAILAAPESGLEPDVQALARSVSERHLQWATARFEADDAEEALRECALMQELYAADTGFTERVRALDARSRLVLAGQLLEQGDARRVLAVLGGLRADAPLALRVQAEARVREAVARPSNFHADRGDLPGLLRWLEQARTLVRPHPHLVSQVERVYLDSVRTTLAVQVPPHPMPETFDALLPAVVTAPIDSAADATIVIANATGQPLTIVLRGPDDRRAILAPGERRKMDILAGEYVQAAQIDAKTRPHVAIIKVEGNNTYGQIFMRGGSAQSARLTPRALPGESGAANENAPSPIPRRL